MKKLTLLFILSSVVTNLAYSQDVIFTTAGDSIIAKVETINEENVTFHRWSNLTGPLYSIRLNNISSIRYTNGVKDVFTTKKQNEVTQQNYDQTTNKSESSLITRSGNTYFHNGQSMNKEEYCLFLQNRCQAAYQKARNGYTLTQIGWGLFGSGLGLDLIGTLGFIRSTRSTSSYNTYSYNTYSYDTGAVSPYYYYTASQKALLFAMVAGWCLEIVSIPCLAVGYSRMHKSVDIYNAQNTSRAQCQPYWSIQANPNGIGLALNF